MNKNICPIDSNTTDAACATTTNDIAAANSTKVINPNIRANFIVYINKDFGIPLNSILTTFTKAHIDNTPIIATIEANTTTGDINANNMINPDIFINSSTISPIYRIPLRIFLIDKFLLNVMINTRTNLCRALININEIFTANVAGRASKANFIKSLVIFANPLTA